MEDGHILYLPVAPSTRDALPSAVLSLLLRITNNESVELRLNAVQLAFYVPPTRSPVDAIVISADVTIAPSTTGFWSNRRERSPARMDDSVLLPLPAPVSVMIILSFDGFDDVSVFHPMTSHLTPVPAQAYAFPARAEDLRPGEYWTGSSFTHATGSFGSQLYAHDMGVIGWDATLGRWSRTLVGTDGTMNEHYRVWGKPVYAMADGKVIHWLDDFPENPTPGETRAEVHDRSRQDYPPAGNHFYIQHGDEVVLYAHMQYGSLNPALCRVGAEVRLGDQLGLVGNSGRSSGPHLHIHAIMGDEPEDTPHDHDGFLRPLLFDCFSVIALDQLDPVSGAGPWVTVRDMGLPAFGPNAIYPDGCSLMKLRPGGGIPFLEYRVLDLLVLLLDSKVYSWLELADPPPLRHMQPRINALIEGLTLGQRTQAKARVDSLRRYLDAVDAAL